MLASKATCRLPDDTSSGDSSMRASFRNASDGIVDERLAANADASARMHRQTSGQRRPSLHIRLHVAVLMWTAVLRHR